jgi:RNA polymerase sigma factor (sigma-70 family)
MRNSREVATADAGDSPRRSLTDAEVDAFWTYVIATREAALRVARRFVGHVAAEDVAHTVAIRFLESLEKANGVGFPADVDEFRGRFLHHVRHRAFDCVRDVENEDFSTHFNWGKEHQPEVRGRKLHDRALDTVFVRNDQGTHDLPAPEIPQEKDDVDELGLTLRACIYDLPEMQREIVSDIIEGLKRKQIAKRLGISVNTYDNHVQKAFCTLREWLCDEVELFKDSDPSRWYEMIEVLQSRHEARRLQPRPRRKKKSAAARRPPRDPDQPSDTAETPAPPTLPPDAPAEG